MVKYNKADAGIYPKYLVFHTISGHNWESEEWMVKAHHKNPNVTHFHDLEEVDDWVFVLKPIKDRHARVALAAYAESCKEDKPKLSADIYEVLGDF